VAALVAASVLAMSALGERRAAAAPYRIDPERSELVVRVLKAGAAAALAHDHVVRAGAWQGKLDVTREPVALAAEIVVDARALEIDEPAVRARHGLDGELSASDRSKTLTTMLGKDQLDVASYPEIRFRTAEIDRAGTDFRLAGELSLHGKTKRITLPLTITEQDGTCTAHGTVRLRQSDFGITPYSAFLGAVRTQDEVELVVTIVAAPATDR
jgi:polyisoprenoid-binding protein YceI